MRSENDLSRNIDWITIGFYVLFVLFGWLNIYAVVYDPEVSQSVFDTTYSSGKQLMWIGGAAILIITILTIDYKFYSTFSYIMYGIMVFVLFITVFMGTEVNGSHSWLNLGFTKVQPAEFAKFTTALALANYLSNVNSRIDKRGTQVISAVLLTIPCVLILLQKETGTVLVFAAFILVLYREGLTPIILVIGVIATLLFITTLIVGSKIIVIVLGSIAGLILLFLLTRIRKNSSMNKYVYRRILVVVGIATVSLLFVSSVGYIMSKEAKILQPHQRNRIMVLIDPTLDKKGVGYQVIQSKIAIGSGSFWGKGYLNGTQTKFNFVPEQDTDFIFCTIGEEHGWFGSTILIILYVAFMARLVFLAERQKDKFSRVYGYSVACIIFIHFMINIGMTLGILPVIGIPLPFFSYGGSSLWGFTILLFVFLKLDASRNQMLRHGL